MLFQKSAKISKKFYQENVYKLQKPIYNKLKIILGGGTKKTKNRNFLKVLPFSKNASPKTKKNGGIMKKFSILKTPKSNFATIFAIIFALLATITISCTNNLTETSPESSYDYILGEYQTSLGKLVITSTENYILTEENTQLATDVKYNYNGTFEVSVLSTDTTGTSSSNFTPYYYYKDKNDNTQIGYEKSASFTFYIHTIHKISVNKNFNEIKEFTQKTTYFPLKTTLNSKTYYYDYNNHRFYSSDSRYIDLDRSYPHTEINYL